MAGLISGSISKQRQNFSGSTLWRLLTHRVLQKLSRAMTVATKDPLYPSSSLVSFNRHLDLLTDILLYSNQTTNIPNRSSLHISSKTSASAHVALASTSELGFQNIHMKIYSRATRRKKCPQISNLYFRLG